MTTTPILWRADQQANTTDSGSNGDDQTGIKMVGLANSNFVALWESNTDGVPDNNQPGTDIIGQLYDPEGNPIGGEFRANQGFFADAEGDFTATALPGGGFVVAYEDTDVNGTAIRYNILDANGVNITTGTIAADPGAQDLGGPSISANADGSFLVAYQQRNVGASTETHATIVNSAGAAGAPFLLLAAGLSTDVGAEGQQVDVTTLVNTGSPGSPGNYVIIARQIQGDSGFNMRIVNPTGGNVLGFTEVSGTLGDADTDIAPAVAALSGGGFVVVWQNTDANDTDILFQRYNAAGVAQGGQVNVDDDSGTDNDITPDVVGLSDGGFVVVWDNNEAGNIALKRFDANGVLVGSEQVVATDSTVANGTPSISLADDGRLLVSWGTSVFTGGINFDNDVRFAVWDPRETTVTGDGTGESITVFADGGTVDGGGGNDTIYGRDTEDTLRGQDGDDTIHGRGGDDFIEGGLNADTIFGEGGNDTIFAMTEADPEGSGVSDTISGGDGNDTITGSATGDAIDGDADDDRLDGGGGADDIQGGTGFDTFVYNTGEAAGGEIIDGGTEDDRLLVQSDESFVGVTFVSIEEIEFDAAFVSNRTVTIDAAHIAAGLANNLIVDFNANATQDTFRVERTGAGTIDLGLFTIQDFDPAGAENDRIRIIGDGATQLITGTGFRDDVEAGGGADAIDAGGGDDWLSGGDGDDAIAGGVGSDTIDWSGATGNIVAVLNASGDGSTNVVNGIGKDTYTGIENMVGGTGSDTLYGNQFGNRIEGGDGADVLDGREGWDTLYGGAGDDRLYVDNVNDIVLEDIGGGADRVYTTTAYTLTAGAEIETMLARDAAATTAIYLYGNEFAQRLTANAGDNILDGKGGIDNMIGLVGNDRYYVDVAGDIVQEAVGGGNDRVYTTTNYTLTAGAEIETFLARDAAATTVMTLTGNTFGQKITGNAGLNVIYGKLGNDTLVGLGGADNFIFDTALGAGNVDAITDFSHADDTIRLDDAIFTGLAAGAYIVASQFHVGAAAADIFDRIIYNNATGALIFDADGSGAGAAQQFAQLTAGLALATNDFYVI